MSSIPMVAPQRRVPRSTMAGVVAVAFALGTLTGFGVPRILAGVSPATATVGAVAVGGVAVHDMSAAAYDALHGPAQGSMSDAAYQALHPSSAPALVPAAVTNDMSAAAYDALHRSTERTMSDAAYDALHAPSGVR